ncbi:hypothetical protein KPA96_13620 [Burkholderia cenocepacia]|uniref:hypothetical protein n=1 Tax=Burkholderia cenocepacia TaxID=95486 RepID=UPI00285B2491|nr:hypothetical protein [Burkholderia cenocepacia]MDR8076695.1 hypothetical protein [Burkholderia cenocepacia]
MDTYRFNDTSILEKRCLNILQNLGFCALKNNDKNKTAIDYKIIVDGQTRYVDFQFSNNFMKWGEIRVDYISAFYPKARGTKSAVYSDYEMNHCKELYELDLLFMKYAEIRKLGKMYDENLSSIIYFIFDREVSNVETEIPDRIFIAKIDSLNDYIKTNAQKLIASKKLMINNKAYDAHGSAFFCLPFDAIKDLEGCFILDLKRLKNAI